MPLLLDTSGTDVLADVLESLRLKGRVFCRCELSAPWAMGLPAEDLSHFHIIQRGTCWLRFQGERDAIALETGDLLLVTRGRRYQLSDAPGTPPIPIEDLAGGTKWGLHAVLRHGGGGKAASLLCGAFEFEGPHAQSFLRVLPEWIRVRKDDLRGNEWLDSTSRFLQREAQHPRMGAATIVTSLLDVLFVEAVRIWLREQPAGGAGWLGALRDPSIGAALGLMHHAPAKQWTVPALSAAVGLSRSPFAAKFTALVGQSPMSYLKRWRLQRAAALLRHKAMALSSVAEQVGYESTAAFSRAFTRSFGVSPGRYRHRGGAGRTAATPSSGRSSPTASGKRRHGKASTAATHARREGSRP